MSDQPRAGGRDSAAAPAVSCEQLKEALASGNASFIDLALPHIERCQACRKVVAEALAGKAAKKEEASSGAKEGAKEESPLRLVAAGFLEGLGIKKEKKKEEKKK